MIFLCSGSLNLTMAFNTMNCLGIVFDKNCIESIACLPREQDEGVAFAHCHSDQSVIWNYFISIRVERLAYCDCIFNVMDTLKGRPYTYMPGARGETLLKLSIRPGNKCLADNEES